MKRSSILISAVLWIAFALAGMPVAGYSQNADGDAAAQDNAQNAPVPHRAISPEAKKAEGNKARKSEPNVQVSSREQPSQGGLLEISESEYRYNRIPGRKVIAPVPESFVASDGAAGQQQPDPNSEVAPRGLFGFGPEASNYIAKGSLAFVIVLIFLMYRLRSRSRSGGVLRRFP